MGALCFHQLKSPASPFLRLALPKNDGLKISLVNILRSSVRATHAALKQAGDLRLFFSARHRDKAAFLPKKVGLSHLTNYFRQIFCPWANRREPLFFISLRLKKTDDKHPNQHGRDGLISTVFAEQMASTSYLEPMLSVSSGS